MLSVSVQTGGFYQESNPAEGFAFMKECGIEAIDYNINDIIPVRDIIKNSARCELFDRPMEEFLSYFTPMKEEAEKSGVKFAQMHGPFPIYVLDQPETTDYLISLTEKCMAAAQYLNCPAIVVHPYSLFNQKTREIEINLEVYRRLIPAAKKYGVMVCLENMFYAPTGHIIGAACSDANEVVRYIEQLNEEAGTECFGYCYDIGHANLTGRSILEDIRILGKHLTVLHIHDNNAQDDVHLMPYSQWKKRGVDWESFIAGLREIGYRGDLSFETFGVMGTFPRAVWPEVMKLISAEGRYFRDRILAE